MLDLTFKEHYLDQTCAWNNLHKQHENINHNNRFGYQKPNNRDRCVEQLVRNKVLHMDIGNVASFRPNKR